MFVTPTTLCCIAITLFSPALFPSTEAIPTPHDRDRAILAYNEATNLCGQLKDSSHEEETAAADWACWRAFVALDDIDSNSCRWRRAKCRSIKGYPQKQCSCKISVTNDLAIKSQLTRTFQECGVGLWPDEPNVEELLPSARFQRSTQKFENDLQTFRSLRKLVDQSINPGRSHGANTPYVDTSGMDIAISAVPEVGSTSRKDAGAAANGGFIMYHTTGDPVLVYSEAWPVAYTCKTCGKGYSSRRSMLQHLESHTTTKTKCTICNRTYSTRSSLNVHIKSQHSKGQKTQHGPSAMLGTGGKIFVCDICGHEYTSAQRVRDHRKSHTEVLICKICLQRYSAKSPFDTHIRKVHPRYKEVTAGISDEEVIRRYNAAYPFVCDVCHNRFTSERSQKQHIASHKSDSTTCIFCNKTLSTRSGWYVHMRTQHKPKGSTSGSAPAPAANGPGAPEV